MKVGDKNRYDKNDHRLLVIWAANCAEHILGYFENSYSQDDRPRKAIEAGRAWARDTLATGKARKAAFIAHASAREASFPEARAAARAAGHAAATAHVPDHARHAADYAIKAVSEKLPTECDVNTAISAERDWQYMNLAVHLRRVVFPDSD